MSKYLANVVYKYALNDLLVRAEQNECLIPAGRVVHVAAQHPDDPLPTLWVEHIVWWSDDTAPELSSSEKLRISVVGTGHSFVVNEAGRHVGSAVCAGGRLVWHVYASETRGTEVG